MISLQFLLFGLGLVCLAAIAASEAGVVQPVVSTSSGKVKGKVVTVKGTTRAVQVYLGIPFAMPPVGQLRFSAPQPPAPWAIVRDATSFPPVCMQATAGIGLQNTIFKVKSPAPSISEDCLYLNIYAPAPEINKKWPVMVWIHGGALIFGGTIAYDGSPMAAYGGVVVVIPQYRLGVQGFFSTGDEHAPGNWGLLDQVRALQWVKKEIANFAGDPESVTIYGHSAGALSVTTLLVSPLANGLFHRAISQSGTFFVNGLVKSDKNDIIQVRDAIATAIGCASNEPAEILACLRTKTAEEVNMPCTSGIVPIVPIVVDGVFLPSNPEDLIAAKVGNKVPLIIGNTNDECGFWIPSILQIQPFENGIERGNIELFVQSYQGLLGSLYPYTIQVTAQYVGQTDDPIEIRDSLLYMCGDILFRKPAAKTADYLKDWGVPVYVYEFRHKSIVSSSILPANVKADHGQEIPFIFGHPFLNGDIRIMGNFTADEQELSRRMMKQWANFACTGNPNSYGLPEWHEWNQYLSY